MNSSGMEIYVFGAGGHAKVVADLARLQGWRVTAFVDSVDAARHGEPFAGAHVSSSTPPVGAAVVAFGDNAARLALAKRLAADGWWLPVLVHPSAVVSPSAKLGAGTVVMAQAVVQAEAMVGEACIVNTGAIVEHDCVLGDGVHLAPRACLCGTVVIGEQTFVGAGSVVREKMTIGARVQLGAGSVVVASLPDDVRAMGVPARVR